MYGRPFIPDDQQRRLHYLGEIQQDACTWCLAGMANSHNFGRDAETIARLGADWFEMPAETMTAEKRAAVHYHVVENTPGYLPDSDDQTLFETEQDAIKYADELTDELVEVIEELLPDDQHASVAGRGTGFVMVGDPSKIHDLGRVISVIACTEQECSEMED